MIRIIGQERVTTATARPAAVAGGAADFAATFAATATAAAPPSFTLSRPAPPRESDRTTSERVDADRLDQALASFRKELSLTPAERVRRDVLKTMELTEEAIEALPPKERVEIEQKVAREVARQMAIMNRRSTGAAHAADGEVQL